MKKSKILALILAVVMVVTCFAACSSKKGDATKTDAGNAKQKLIVGFDAEFPPYGFVAEDGSYDGFDLAVAKELCRNR